MFLKKTLKTDQTLIYFSICFHIVFPIYIKMLTGYYKKQQQRLQKRACQRYQGMSEEEKTKVLTYS